MCSSVKRVALAASFTLAAAAASAQPGSRVPPEIRARAEQVKACADARAAVGKFSGVVTVAYHGDHLLSAVYGLADPETGRKNTLETPFDTGSMPKMFTAVALAQLVETGKVRFEDPVDRYLEGLPPEVAGVTLHQLVTHTSGLGSYFSPANAELIRNARTAADLVPAAAATGLAFTPGSKWRYSNAGFVLAGAVVEKVSGQPFPDYVRSRILAPAGMSNTTLDGVPEKGAAGLSREGADPAEPPSAVITPFTGRYSPAGGAFSTAGDMVRFAHALSTGTVLRRETLERLWTSNNPGPDTPPRPGRSSGYGYGFGVLKLGDVRVVGHNGGLPGYNSGLSLAPEEGWTVAVLGNYDPPAGDLLSAAARDIMSGLEPVDGVCRGEDPPPTAAIFSAAVEAS